MSAHTPGPWAVEIEDGYVCIVSGGITIAEVDGGEAEYIDNAKLLAAGPELLEALEDAASALADAGKWNTAQRARAAIAKATKSQP